MTRRAANAQSKSERFSNRPKFINVMNEYRVARLLCITMYMTISSSSSSAAAAADDDDDSN